MKKKYIRTWILISLLAVLSIAFAACGDTKSKETENNLPGTYVAQIDFTNYLKEQMGQSVNTDSSITAEMILVLAENGTFTMSLDTAAFLQSVSDTLENTVEKMVKGMFGEAVSDEELNAVAKSMGYDSFDAYLQDTVSNSMSAVTATIKDQEYKAEGTYTLNNGSLEMKGGNTELGVKNSAVMEDGSISMTVGFGGNDMDIIFVKK